MHGFKKEVYVKEDKAYSEELWKNILNTWLSINREYIEDWKEGNEEYEDCAYWYNERTCVGILAGAIWRRGGLCLEEYSTTKGVYEKNENTGKKEISETEYKYGRTDLYFYVGDEEYIVEAKFLMGKKITKEKIESALNDAKMDCIKSKKFESNNIKLMALVFIVPFLENDKINFDLIKKDVDLYCSLEKISEGNIKAKNGNIANSCYIIGKEVEN